MAEALVSVLLQQLASITLTQIDEEVRLVVGVDREIENLILHLQAVQAVLQDAEERQVKEANVRHWLRHLKDVSYQMNDVLGEWNSEILKHQIANQEKEVLINKKKVRFFICSPCISFRKIGHQVILRHDIARRIKEINERLTLISILRQNYHFQSPVRGTGLVLERPKTTSFINISSIVGREEEKKTLISMLLSESSQGRSQFVIIPIVGMGGLGKTSFAKLVYNDENVKSHFENRIWVCVSEPFEEIKIAKAIVQVLKKDDNRIKSTTLQPLLECITESINRKKFLLVLDDVWNPTDEWEQLYEALKNGDIGSRILVTTRNKTVGIRMGATADHMINLNKLSDQDCMLLFRSIAFHGRERDESKLLDDNIRNKIVKTCSGLPLVAKTLASLMRYKEKKEDWVHIFDSKVWELEEAIEQQVFQSLLLSYYDLAPEVRPCLLYCANFPKDYVFDKYTLIELWMSQEYLSTKGDKEKERLVGEIYFDNLVMRSFFQDFVKDKDNNIAQCKMHDMVHDFVQFLTKTECFVLEAESADEKNSKAFGI